MTQKRDLQKELDGNDGELPVSWLPKVGDSLIGELVRYDVGYTTYGRAYIVVICEENTGELRGVWLLHHVLRGEFAEKRPRPGERLGITRLPDADKGYKRYVLLLDRGGEGELPDFDSLGPAADQPPRVPEPPPDDDIPF